jgi:hypothetical protein
MPLSDLTRNSVLSGYLSGYAKSIVSSPQFINVVASIKMKQDLVTLAQMDACEKLNTLPANEKEALYAWNFPENPCGLQQFTCILAFTTK